jgi:hypothetical protein
MGDLLCTSVQYPGESFLTIYKPLILKVRDIIFFSRAKKINSRTFKIRGTLVFLCPKERERENKSKSESESKSKCESESKSERGKEKEKRTGNGTGTGKGDRERDREVGQGKGQGKGQGEREIERVQNRWRFYF